MPKIAGLASGRGQTLKHLQDCRPGGAVLAVIISETDEASILEAAKTLGIDTAVIEQREGMDRQEHERRLLQVLSEYDLDALVLDGYAMDPSGTFLEASPPTLDVHRSLLPAFPGENPEQRAIEAGVAVSGCTVRLLGNGTDGHSTESGLENSIVTQEPVPVYPDDDRSDLASRIRNEGVFRALPRAIELIVNDQVTVDETGVSVRETAGQFPDRRMASADRVRDLRYGENPHQKAALYRDRTCETANVVEATQRNPGAKALSYNNYNDANGALDLVREFDAPAAAVIKHTNPAGCSLGKTPASAYENALSTDPKSAFGGIVALNRTCDEKTAKRIVDSFKEAVVAPGFTDGALSVLTRNEDLRLLDVGPIDEVPGEQVEKPIVGGRLVQERDRQSLSTEDLETVTERAPSNDELESLLFAWQTVKHVKSNGIVLARGTETVGIGMGQASRVDAVDIAIRKARKDANGKTADGSVMASDAFFPFPDGIELAANAGVEAVIQPGGSVNDEAVIDAANDHGLAMVFTGTRAFRHD